MARRRARLVLAQGVLVLGLVLAVPLGTALAVPSVSAAAIWSTTNQLPIPLNNQVALTDGSSLYIAGGSSSGHTNAVFSAPIGGNGVLGAWQTLTHLPVALYNHAGVLQNSNLVILGGQGKGAVAQAAVYAAPLKGGGAIGAWSTTTALPQARFDSAAVASGGFVWNIGGFGSDNLAHNTVYVAQQSGGSLGAWTTTTALPQIAGEIAATIANGWIYVLGGHSVTGGGGGLSTVYAARIGANGALGGWATLTALPQARWDLGVTAVNGYLWAIGGYNSSARATATVYRAPLNASNGTIGAWTSLTALPAAVAEHTVTTAQGFLFVAGSKLGASGSSRAIYTASVSSFPAPPASTPTATTTTTPTPTATPAPPPPANDTWTAYLDGGNHQGYNSAFNAVGTSNASSLKLKWTLGTGGNVEANPAVAVIAHAAPAACAGAAVPMIFIGSWNGDLYAANATTGALCWRTFLAKDTNPKPNSLCITSWGITSSATVATVTINGTATQVVFAGAGDVLFAVSATTGKILWQTALAGVPAGTFSPAVIWSSPAYSSANNTLYTSTASFCDEVQPKTGTVYALDATSGAITAHTAMLPGNAPGAGVWGSPTVSSSLGMVFVATGNGYSGGQQACVTSESRSCAVVALNWTTLAVTSSWQIPASQFVADGDFGDTPTLFAGSGGATWLGVGNKNGWYYVLNAANLAGGLIWLKQLSTGGSNPIKGIIAPSAYFPGTVGGCTGVLYVAAGNTTIGGKAFNGSVSALCALTGKTLWQKGTTGLVWAAPALANGLEVNQSGPTLEVRNWSTGALLFSFVTNHNIQGEAAFANGRIYFGSTNHNVYALGL